MHMVASHLLSRADSLPFSSFVLTPFVISASSRCSYRFSTVVHFVTSVVAVFCPIPATPEILSELSPISAFKSIRFIGSKP